MSAAVAVLLGSVASAAALVAVVLQGPGVRAPRVVVQVPRPPLLLNLLPFQLPQVEVESEVLVRLQGRQSFSAAMASSSLPTEKPTYERVPRSS